MSSLNSRAASGSRISYAVAPSRHVIISHQTFLELFLVFEDFTILSQLSAMDASARVTMKDAAKCDKRREWQNSENQ